MMKIVKIAGLLAIAFSITACGMSDRASLNAVDENRLIYAVPETMSSKQVKTYGYVAQLDVSQGSAEKVLAMLDNGAKKKTNSKVVSKNAAGSSQIVLPEAKPSYKITDVIVEVPDYLVVSEANLYLPQADIVWREDPLGDRRAQVKTIIESAVRAGTAPIQGERPVIMRVRVKMFHALTEKTRNSVGGRHNIQFDYVLLDAETGQPVTSAKSVNASLKAYGGRRAYKAMRRGETQKVRITRHVARVVYEELNGSAEI